MAHNTFLNSKGLGHLILMVLSQHTSQLARGAHESGECGGSFVCSLLSLDPFQKQVTSIVGRILHLALDG